LQVNFQKICFQIFAFYFTLKERAAFFFCKTKQTFVER
jgi:hypothetical protein